MPTTTKTTPMKKMATTKKASTTTRKPRAARSGGKAGSGGAPVDVAAVVDRICADGFFQPLRNDHPFMKVGIDGLAKVGKSQTLAELAIGLHRRIKSTKPVVVIDTENASRFLVPLFAAAGIPVVVRKTSSLVDWSEAVRRAADGEADIVVTDSLTHLWEDTIAAFCQANEVQRVEGPAAWMALKEVWHREWAELFRDARVHLLHASRAGDNYVDVLGKDGQFDSVKVGTKARGETEAGFEPSLLVHVQRDPVLGVCAHIEDRTRTIHGETPALPIGRIYDVFAGIVDATLAGAVEPVATEQRSRAALFGTTANKSRVRSLVGEVEGLLQRHWPSSSAKDRQTRANALHQAFGHSSVPRLERSDEKTLQLGLHNLQVLIAAGGPTTTATPSPDAAVATIRTALAVDPGNDVDRRKQLTIARNLAATLPAEHRATALGIAARTARAWEQADMDQRVGADDAIA